MQTLTLSFSSSSSTTLLRRSNQNFLSQKSPHPHTHLTHSSFFNPLRFSAGSDRNSLVMKKKLKRGFGPVCYSGPLSPSNLQWVSTISCVGLMFAKGTAIQKAFLVPLFALQAPEKIISWIKSDYGIWTAFLALLVRLFFYIPGELELPFIAMLMVIVSPYQAVNLRGKQGGLILSLFIAGFLAFQHFTRAGSFRRAFDQGSIIATLAIVCIVVVPCLLLI